MGRLKIDRINLLANKRALSEVLRRGGDPKRCFIREDGSASINGVIVMNHTGSNWREIHTRPSILRI
jgi:hypothetical protein